MDPQVDDKLQAVDNPLKVLQPGERVVCEIKRHPIGLLGMYLSSAVIIVIGIAAAILVPHYLPNMTSQTKMALASGAVILSVIILLYAYIGSSIYKANRWIVTTDSITQVSQMGLFRKQTSQLSLANLEDVTVEQDGVLQSMFGFGSLRAETAGEHSKFTFLFCPHPSEYAKRIIAAHEQYIAARPEEMHVTNQAVANTPAFNQSAPAVPYQQSQPSEAAQSAYQPPETPVQPIQPGDQPPAGSGQEQGR